MGERQGVRVALKLLQPPHPEFPFDVTHQSTQHGLLVSAAEMEK